MIKQHLLLMLLLPISSVIIDEIFPKALTILIAPAARK